jgi:hypothetical protein
MRGQYDEVIVVTSAFGIENLASFNVELNKAVLHVFFKLSWTDPRLGNYYYYYY